MNGNVDRLKSKMMMARIAGIIACLMAVVGMVLKYCHIIEDWLCLVIIAYAVAAIFTMNSSLQNIRVGNPWGRVNSIIAIIMYALVIFLIVYGFASGEMVLFY